MLYKPSESQMTSDMEKVFAAVAATRLRHSSAPVLPTVPVVPILVDVSTKPDARRYARYRWCDYIELRCLTHTDKRFSRDNLAEAIGESKDTSPEDGDDAPDPDAISLEDYEESNSGLQETDDDEALSAECFRQLRWRSRVFGESWPFELDEHAKEVKLKARLTATHYFYLQLLLSSLLKYCPKKRRDTYTASFEQISFYVFKDLMPKKSQVHRFGAGHGTRYTGKLFDKLTRLAQDIRGELRLERRDFPATDVGDGGLDLVAWHDLGDERDHIPIALGQCGCTVDGWPDKMLEASPAKLSKKLVTGHDWSTYYFMPLDLTDERDGKMDWQEKRNMATAIVIDRLRLVKLADVDTLEHHGALVRSAIDEALALRIS